MKTVLFPSVARKYFVELDNEIKQSISDLYTKFKFEQPRPFTLYNKSVESLLSLYSDVLQEFLEEVNPDGSATITNVRLVVLGSGDQLDRDCSLPGHYSAVHYVKYDETRHQADLYYHPSYDLLNCLRPDLKSDEMDPVSGVWVKEGDLVIYPSYLHTSSPKNQSNEERITLMFTFVVTENDSRESGSEESPE